MKRSKFTEEQLTYAGVSLEITRRCNLDHTLCYLSDFSKRFKTGR